MGLLEGNLERRDEVYCELIRLNENDMSYDWFQKLYEFELAESKQKGQFFTPKSLGILCSALTGQSGHVHEPTAGNGSMIIADWQQRRNKVAPWDYFPSQNMVTCWDLSARSIPILLLNLSIHWNYGICLSWRCAHYGSKAKVYPTQPERRSACFFRDYQSQY